MGDGANGLAVVVTSALFVLTGNASKVATKADVLFFGEGTSFEVAAFAGLFSGFV